MIRRGRLLAWIAPLLLLAQVALAVHQLEHRMSADAAAPGHECVLCNAPGGAAPPPEPFAVLPPDFASKAPASTVADAACCAHIGTHFLSRAPPVSAAL